MISVFQHKINNNLTIRDYDSLKKYLQLINWGRQNPVQFIEKIFGITLMDYQKWLIGEMWTREYVVVAASRNAGKSFLIGVFIMARGLLFPKTQTKIIAENWLTCNESFKKVQDIATNNIKSIITTNTVFADELVISAANKEGFVNDTKNGNHCALMNGSTYQTVAGSSRSARGKRANLLVYDEAATVSQNTFDVTEPFVTQNADFKLGGDFDSEIYPVDIPNLRIYIGSAGDTSCYFYSKYREGTKRMLIGDERYFVADLNCEIPMHPTVNGKKVPALLSQTEIDRKMRENEIAANREYYNIFDNFNLEDSVVSRSDMFVNTESFIPGPQPCHNPEGKRNKYVITYDPASKNDNAPVLVMEIYREMGTNELHGRCVYMENFVVTYKDGSKRPMRLDEQTERLRELIYIFNGKENAVPYENVTVLID